MFRGVATSIASTVDGRVEIFEILTSSRYEKSCQIMVRIFGVFVGKKIIPW